MKRKKKKSAYLLRRERRFFFAMLGIYLLSYGLLFMGLIVFSNLYGMKQRVMFVFKILFFIIAWLITLHYSHSETIMAWTQKDGRDKVKRNKPILKKDDKKV